MDNLEEWKLNNSGQVYIKNEKFHRNAELFLNNYPDFKANIESCLNKQFNGLKYIVRKNKNKYSKGITAGSLNKAIKSNLSTITSLKFEVEYKDGVLFDSPKTGGFDFALFDEDLNLHNFRNYCLGKKAIHNGVDRWISELESRPTWKLKAKELNILDSYHISGIDLPSIKKDPTIIGEVQFANWALAYYDLFKVLHLDNLVDLDLLVYITATDNLDSYLSEGNVNFTKMQNIIEEYSSILKVPIWLIGIDIKNDIVEPKS